MCQFPAFRSRVGTIRCTVAELRPAYALLDLVLTSLQIASGASEGLSIGQLRPRKNVNRRQFGRDRLLAEATRRAVSTCAEGQASSGEG
jgi:hypothetical protein